MKHIIISISFKLDVLIKKVREWAKRLRLL